MLPIIQQRKYAYIFSILLSLASIVVIGIWGLKLGIDFQGGTLMEIGFEKNPAPTVAETTAVLEPLSLQSLSLQPTNSEGGKQGMIIRYLASNEEANTAVVEHLRELDPEVQELRTDFIGASVSSQIKKNAFSGIILSLIGITFYIAWAFRRVSGTVTSWEYGIGAIIALAHDILITLGIFAVLGHFFGIEVGVPFVAALLAILGYSVNDTIVVYDRVRENVLRSSKNENFEGLVNRSLNETLSRSMNTSLTTIITLLAITIFGGESIRFFSLAILVGVTFGTYSSVFIASALLVTRFKMKMRK